jgi:hypothetical protein
MYKKIELAVKNDDPSWVAQFRNDDGTTHFMPVVAWTYGVKGVPGPDFKTDTYRAWDGLVVFSDGPEPVGNFANFIRFFNLKDLDEYSVTLSERT